MKLRELSKRRREEKSEYDGMNRKEWVEKQMKGINKEIKAIKKYITMVENLKDNNPEVLYNEIENAKVKLAKYEELQAQGNAIIEYELDEEREAYDGVTEKEYYAGINRGIDNFVKRMKAERFKDPILVEYEKIKNTPEEIAKRLEYDYDLEEEKFQFSDAELERRPLKH